jgi:hypothetical protein
MVILLEDDSDVEDSVFQPIFKNLKRNKGNYEAVTYFEHKEVETITARTFYDRFKATVDNDNHQA